MGRVSADGRSHYGVALREGKAQLNKMVAQVITPMGSPLAIEDMSRGKCFMTALAFDGANITVTVDRKELSVVDSDLSAGTIGLATIDTDAAFDNIVVYER